MTEGYTIYLPIGLIVFMIGICIKCCMAGCNNNEQRNQQRVIIVTSEPINQPPSPSENRGYDLPPSYYEAAAAIKKPEGGIDSDGIHLQQGDGGVHNLTTLNGPQDSGQLYIGENDTENLPPPPAYDSIQTYQTVDPSQQPTGNLR